MTTLFDQPAPSLPQYQPRTIPSHPQYARYAQFAAALAKLQWPEYVTTGMVAAADEGLKTWLENPGNRKKLPGYLGACGYAHYRNPEDARGRWYVNGERLTFYRR